MAVRYFTLDEAQALLPEVRAHLGQALQLHSHLRAALARLTDGGHEVSWAILRGEEELDTTDTHASQRLARAQMIYSTLREGVTELEGLGVEVKSVTGGLVDFRSWCDGEREVHLCFCLGEAQITHFHGLEAGFDGREPIEGHSFTTAPADADAQSDAHNSAQTTGQTAEPSSDAQGPTEPLAEGHLQ